VSTKPALSLTVQYAVDPTGLPTRAQFRKWVRAALATDCTVTLRLVDEEEGRALNATYRGKDYATNVLTFPYEAGPPLEGDIALCAAVVAAEARAQEKPDEAHWAHLVVHGMLHLQGHDHEDDAEARRMEALETQILGDLGYPDPYLPAA
jgi:probable rRNA maturation factor